MRFTLPMFLAVLACDQPDPKEGIAVGNPPGMASLRGAPAASTGVTFTSLNFAVSDIYLEDCDGVGTTEPSGGVLDLIGDDPVEVAAGTWCAIGFTTVEPLLLEGEVSNGGQFSFSAELGRLMVYGEVEVEAADEGATDDPTGDLVLELGAVDWVSETELALGPTDELRLGADCLADPLCSSIWTGIMHRSAIYGDDGDGRVSDGERDAGDSARGTERRE